MRCNGVRCSSAGRTFRRSDETPELSGLRRVESRREAEGPERREIYQAARTAVVLHTGTPTPADPTVSWIYVRKTAETSQQPETPRRRAPATTRGRQSPPARHAAVFPAGD